MASVKYHKRNRESDGYFEGCYRYLKVLSDTLQKVLTRCFKQYSLYCIDCTVLAYRHKIYQIKPFSKDLSITMVVLGTKSNGQVFGAPVEIDRKSDSLHWAVILKRGRPIWHGSNELM